ncbi:unnamed protein product [Pylaiella littoralis]
MGFDEMESPLSFSFSLGSSRSCRHKQARGSVCKYCLGRPRRPSFFPFFILWGLPTVFILRWVLRLAHRCSVVFRDCRVAFLRLASFVCLLEVSVARVRHVRGGGQGFRTVYRRGRRRCGVGCLDGGEVGHVFRAFPGGAAAG